MVDFFWQITKGSRWYFAAILALTGGIAAFEAVLFAFFGLDETQEGPSNN